MACICRCRQTRVNHLFSQLKRSYFQVSAPYLSDYVSQNRLPSSSNPKQILGLLGRSNGFFDNVRFFAAPLQSKKEDTKKSKGPRLNEQIKSQMVRLVSDEGHEIVPFHVALERAKSLNSDLVEVNCNSNPIVCKIMDYHRDRYQQQLKEKERSKNKAESSVRKGSCKEVRLSLKIEKKDLEMKADMAKRLMERGYRVKCMVLVSYSAEEDEKARASKEQKSRALIDRLHALIEDVAFVESGPRVEKSQAYVIVRHIKFGPSKKGNKGAAAKSADPANSGGQKDTTGSKSTGEDDSSTRGASQNSDSEDNYDESLCGDSDSESTPQHQQLKMEKAARISDQNKKIVPNFTVPSENRYARSSTQDSTRLRRPPPPQNFTGPDQAQNFTGPDRAQNFTGPASNSNSAENRYSRSPPPRKQYPDRPPPSSSYGMFSNSSQNHSQMSPASDPPNPPTENANKWSGLFSGHDPNAKAGRTFPNLPKDPR